MANFETGYCRELDYNEGKESLVEEHNLSIGALYTVMFAFNPRKMQYPDFPAAKYPSRITSKEEQESGLLKVGFTVLNADLQPSLETEGELRNGFFAPEPNIRVEKSKVATGYFRQYYDQADQELFDMKSAEPILSS